MLTPGSVHENKKCQGSVHWIWKIIQVHPEIATSGLDYEKSVAYISWTSGIAYLYYFWFISSIFIEIKETQNKYCEGRNLLKDQTAGTYTCSRNTEDQRHKMSNVIDLAFFIITINTIVNDNFLNRLFPPKGFPPLCSEIENSDKDADRL